RQFAIEASLSCENIRQSVITQAGDAMRKSSWLRRGLLGSVAGLCLTGTTGAQNPSETTVQSFTPSVVVNASAQPPSFLQRIFGWLPFVGSSPTPPPTTRAAQMTTGYNGLNPGEMMGTRPLQGTPVGKYRPIQ